MTEKKKRLTYFTGQLKSVSETKVFNTKNGVKKGAVICLVTDDDQKVFFEVRDAILNKIEKLGFKPFDLITVGFVFMGSEKETGNYNNLFVNFISYAE
jgi:hypothetical protein